MTNEELQQLVLSLQQQVTDLTIRLDQRSEFEDVFSDRIIINKKVQFMQPVYRSNGTLVTTINP